MTTEQEQFWTGAGGDEYTARNRVNWVTRIPFWTYIVAKTGVDSVLEVGCNFGANLLALRTLRHLMLNGLHGIDVNEVALMQAENLGLNISHGKIDEHHATRPLFGLVFTAGLLIHIPPDNLDRTMRAIVDHSAKYVLAIEYEADQEEEIAYRGQYGLLWKRPYGQLYENLGLACVDSGHLRPEDGFDNCTFWLMRKP